MTKSQKIEPSTKYRISFVARGSGDLNTYIFPGVAPSQDGQRSDGRIITSLTGDFRDYSYEVTTYANFSGDTGSTPAWAYKSIPVGDIDGDTLTVTLTIHQTAGAKLDQVCVALYDSTRTKALATYAYPATEQTNTITIVDKWPSTDAQLLFYANDKTINSNTTIEFDNVTIVGS